MSQIVTTKQVIINGQEVCVKVYKPGFRSPLMWGYSQPTVQSTSQLEQFLRELEIKERKQ